MVSRSQESEAGADVSPVSGVDPDVLDTPAAGGMVVRGSALRFGSYASVIALSVISAAVLTRHLGRVSFGQYTTVISLAAVISSVTDAGMSALGTREYAMRGGAARDALMRDLLGLRVALTLIGVLIATAFAFIVGYPPALLAGTALAALAVVAMVFQHTLSIPLTTRLRLGYLSALEVARQVVTGALLIALVLLGAGVLPLLAVALVANLLLLPPTAALVRGEISMRMSLRPRRWVKLLRLTVAFSLASAANTIYLFAAQIITSLVASGVQSGLFAVSLPVLARAARDDRARLGYALQRTFEVSLLVGMAAAIAVIAGARFMIAVVAGPEYAGAAAALRIEGGVLLASFVLAGWGFGLLALHRHRVMLLANLAALAVSAILTVILARADGARGAALASVCGETTLALLYLVGLIRGSPELRPELRAAAKIVLAAIPALAVALVPGMSQLLQPIAALAVFAVLILLMRAVPSEVYELIPPGLRRSR
jgi:O-antigen/teichoic acid export membrane protein